MGASQHAAERAALLSRAIALCTDLRDTLEQIGSSRLTRSPDYLPANEYATISHVHELESTLHRRLQELSEKRNDALSPLSRLPDDVLRIIFQHGHGGQLLEHRIFALGNGFSRLVSRVSRRWRSVALDTASLWTYVRFANPKYLAEQDSEPLHPWYGSAKALHNMYITNLERSKRSLLNVDMHLPALPGAKTMVREYMRVCPDRVAELILSVHTSSADSLAAVVPCISQTRAVLKRLRLSLVHAMSDLDARGTVEELLALDVPQLTDVELHSVPLPLRYEPTFTALVHCTRLHLTLNRGSQFSPTRLLQLLKCTPSLQELHLMLLPQPDALAPETDERLVLPELRRLKCTFTSVSPHLPFSQLAAPKLEKLALDVLSRLQNTGQHDTYISDILGFLHASAGEGGAPPPVKTLAIKGGIMSSLDRILPAVPGLETLQIVIERQWSAGDEAEYVLLLSKLGTPLALPTSEGTSEQPETALAEEEPTPPSLEGTEVRDYLCPKLKALESLAWASPSHLRPLTQLAALRRSAGLPLQRIKLADWPGQWIAATQNVGGMPEGPGEQYELERALARELGEEGGGGVLECAGWRWEWSQGGRWTRGGVSDVDAGRAEE